jgi:poly-beta-1,6-N-acetyl-D-glucosamine biosynthesis protein PgaD
VNKPPPIAWPPLITDARMPRRLIWRDRLLTLGMWLLLLYFARGAIALMVGEVLDWLGRDNPMPEIDWVRLGRQLAPYLLAAGLLGLWLLGWGLAAVRRVRRAERLPEPRPVSLEEDAKRGGCTPAELASWRELRVAIVHLDDHGHVRVEPGRQPDADAASFTSETDAPMILDRRNP